MNRIDRLFKEKKKDIVSIYLTAGYPALNDTCSLIKTLERSGVDLLEIGIPFSDPLADGPVIQKSSQQALNNGMSLRLLFEQLKGIRNEVSIPLVLMGYLNPVMQFGFDRFIEECRECGIDGLILPDLPLSIYKAEYASSMEEADLRFIMLITPQTDENRIREITNTAGGKGFLYMVADSATTGAKSEINTSQREYFQRIADLDLGIPRIIGFGISNSSTFKSACEYANGAIIGSAFIQAIGAENELPVEEKAEKFVRSILEAS